MMRQAFLLGLLWLVAAAWLVRTTGLMSDVAEAMMRQDAAASHQQAPDDPDQRQQGRLDPPTTRRYVKGQLIVKFKSDGAHAVTECAHCLLNQRRPFQAATADRLDSLDRLNTRFKVKGAKGVLQARHSRSTAEAKQQAKESFEQLTVKFNRRLKRTPPTAQAPDVTNVFVLEMDPAVSPMQAALEYAKDPHVEFAEPNYLMEATLLFNDPYYNSSNSWGQGYRDLWGLDMLDLEKAWLVSQGQGIVVAVVDTGLDYNHPDLATNVWMNPGEIPNNAIDDDGNGYVDDVRGWDFIGTSVYTPAQDNDPYDGDGHGTHVSGTIAAIGNNNIGIVGVAPQAKIMPLKGLDDQGSGGIQGLSDAIVYAAANGADVINNSWGPGTPIPTPQVLKLAVEYAQVAGVVVVAAAGNSNDAVEKGYYPASLPQVISVGSVDHLGNKSDFSNFGQKLDIMAPGGDSSFASPNRTYQNILSLRAQSTDLYGDGKNVVGTDYYRARGTSMASPHISGVAALLLASTPAMTIAQLKKQLYGNAVDQNTLGFDPQSGFGLAKASAALEDSQPYMLARITQPASGTLFGQQLSITGIAAAKNFSRYELLVGQGSAPASWQTTGVTLNGGEVIEGPLGMWDASGLPSGLWTIRLVVYDAAGNSREHRVLVNLDNSLQKGWPQQVLYGGGSYNASMVVGDLEGDGTLEVVSGSYVGLLYAWHFDGTPVAGFPVYVGGYNGNALTPALGDVDGDGNLEIAVGANTTHPNGCCPDLHLLNHDGTPLPGWPKRSANYISDAVVLADLDGDGKLELIVGEEDWQVHAYHANGAPVAGWPVRIDAGQNVSAVAVGDLDNDGRVEVVATDYEKLYAWHRNGTLVAGFPVVTGGSLHQPVLADLDQDRSLEIIVNTDQGLAAYRANGTLMPGWPNALAGGLPCTGDLNGDGRPEVVVGTGQGVVALQGDGMPLPGWPYTFGFHNPAWMSACTIGDIDGDGEREVVLPAYDSWNGIDYLYAFHHDGTVVSGWPKLDVDYFQSPVLADFDADGDVEVAAMAPYRGQAGVNVYVWDLPGAYNPNLMDWPMYGRNARHTAAPDPGAVQPGPNQPPVLAPIGNKAVNEGQLLVISLSATDPESDPLTFEATPLPAGATFNAASRIFYWTPGYTQAGTYTITFRVKDSGGLEDSETVTITVNNINVAPAFSPIGPKKTLYGQLLQFSVSATDLDGDVLIYSATPLPMGATFANQTFAWTPTAAQMGSYTVTFRVSDGVLSKSEAVAISVYDAVPRAPVLDPISNKTGDEKQLLFFMAHATDANGDPVTYAASPLPAGASFYSYPATGQFIWTPSPGQAGTYTLTVTAMDPGGLSTSETLTIKIEKAMAMTLLSPNGGEVLQVGQIHRIRWRSTSITSVTIGFEMCAGCLDWIVYAMPANPAEGEYFYDWTVNVGGWVLPRQARIWISGGKSGVGGVSDESDATFTIQAAPPNRAPVLAPVGSQAVNEGQQLKVQLLASDADGDALSFTAGNLPPGAGFDPSTATFSWTPTATQAGVYPNIHFEVSDGQATDSEEITITAREAILVLGGKIAMADGSPVSTITVQLRKSGKLAGSTTTDAQGRYQFEGFTPGEYRLLPKKNRPLRKILPASRRVTLGTQDQTALDFTAVPR